MKMNQSMKTTMSLAAAMGTLALATSANAALVYHDITLTNTTNLVAGSSGGGTKWELRGGNSNFFNDDATQSDTGTEDPIVMTITGLAFNATYTDVRIYNRADQGRGASYSYDGSSFTEYVGGTFTDTSNGGIGNDAAPIASALGPQPRTSRRTAWAISRLPSGDSRVLWFVQTLTASHSIPLPSQNPPPPPFSASVDSHSSSVAVNNGYGATGPPSPQVTRPRKTKHPSNPTSRHAGRGVFYLEC
jgi:hypothetical protein